jgi:serpin B
MFRAQIRARALLIVPLGLLAALLMAACDEDSGPGRPAGAAEIVQSEAPRDAPDPAAATPTSAAVQAFAADLFAVLAREEGNVVFSPYSVAVALAMTRAGAEGETAEQMDAVLRAVLAGDLHAGFNAIEQALAERPGEYPISGMDDESTAELELATANQLWGQQGFDFESPFLDLLAAQYGAGMRLVDYIEAHEEARELINAWVAEQTRDRIPELIPEGVLDEMTRLVLTNAIYLNAPWMHRFEREATELAPFTRLDGGQVPVEMMSLGGMTRVHYGEGADFEAVRLPYVDGSLAMIVVVPREGQYESFEAGLDAAKLDEVIGSLGDALVDLRMPRFEFRTQAGLKSALSELGMPVAFEPGGADFSGINHELGEDLYIQDVIHEAFISVDEDGTEAAAATAVVVGVVSMPQVQAELTVDRPFLFLIRDEETGALLFMGRVLDPTQ